MLFAFLQQPPAIAPFDDLTIVEENQHRAEHGKCHALRKIWQKALCALAFLALHCIILIDFLKIIVDLAGHPSLPNCFSTPAPCSRSENRSDVPEGV